MQQVLHSPGPAQKTAAPEFWQGAGRWAAERLAYASLNGDGFSPAALRTADVLRKEEWEHFDEILIEEALLRLVGVGDLMAAGLTDTIANAMGKTVFEWEESPDMDPATVSMDGMARGDNDAPTFALSQMPLPITHKDWFINLRKLSASRELGESLDTMQARIAGRLVAEKLEDILFNGYANSFGGNFIRGYTTHPDRKLDSFGTTHWGNAATTGEEIVADVLSMIDVLSNSTNRMHGPYNIYVPGDARGNLSDDFKANSDKTTLMRILEIDGINSVKFADQLASANVVMVQMTPDVVQWLEGEALQTVQWDVGGGFGINFKAFALQVPLIRSDPQNRSGIVHMS